MQVIDGLLFDTMTLSIVFIANFIYSCSFSYRYFRSSSKVLFFLMNFPSAMAFAPYFSKDKPFCRFSLLVSERAR